MDSSPAAEPRMAASAITAREVTRVPTVTADVPAWVQPTPIAAAGGVAAIAAGAAATAVVAEDGGEPPGESIMGAIP